MKKKSEDIEDEEAMDEAASADFKEAAPADGTPAESSPKKRTKKDGQKITATISLLTLAQTHRPTKIKRRLCLIRRLKKIIKNQSLRIMLNRKMETLKETQ